MSHYCSICGRELTRSNGPIGPKCLQKMKPKSLRSKTLSTTQYVKMAAKYDMYGESDGQGKNDQTGENSSGEEVQ